MSYFERALQHRRESVETVQAPNEGSMKGWPFPLTKEAKKELKDHASLLLRGHYNFTK